MFGAYRLMLALFVAGAHFWVGFPQYLAVYAVWGFYSISGYLITRVLNDVYTLRGGGGLPSIVSCGSTHLTGSY